MLFKTRQTFFVLCVSLLILSFSGYAQSGGLRIGVINSALFNQANGVTKILQIEKTLEAEMGLKQQELNGLQAKIKTLENDMRNGKGSVEATTEAIEKLQRELRSKTNLYQSQAQKKYEAELKPVYTKLEEVTRVWSKEKGYEILIDVAKDGKKLFWIEDEVVNRLTNEVISRMNKAL